MSRSYKKNVYSTFISSNGMKEWRTHINRKLRHKAKQLINNAKDYDAMILPILDEIGDLWNSPLDGKKRWQKKPYLNQCEVDKERYYNSYGSLPSWREKYYVENTKHCNCYPNKRYSWWWRLKRK